MGKGNACAIELLGSVRSNHHGSSPWLRVGGTIGRVAVSAGNIVRVLPLLKKKPDLLHDTFFRGQSFLELFQVTRGEH
jgi:hypothetical protein